MFRQARSTLVVDRVVRLDDSLATRVNRPLRIFISAPLGLEAVGYIFSIRKRVLFRPSLLSSPLRGTLRLCLNSIDKRALSSGSGIAVASPAVRGGVCSARSSTRAATSPRGSTSEIVTGCARPVTGATTVTGRRTTSSCLSTTATRSSQNWTRRGRATPECRTMNYFTCSDNEGGE